MRFIDAEQKQNVTQSGDLKVHQLLESDLTKVGDTFRGSSRHGGVRCGLILFEDRVCRGLGN